VTHGTSRTRTVSAEGVARVEGEGSLRVVVHDGTVSEVSLDIFEPPRYFEAMLVGRNFNEAPDITRGSADLSRCLSTHRVRGNGRRGGSGRK